MLLKLAILGLSGVALASAATVQVPAFSAGGISSVGAAYRMRQLHDNQEPMGHGEHGTHAHDDGMEHDGEREGEPPMGGHGMMMGGGPGEGPMPAKGMGEGPMPARGMGEPAGGEEETSSRGARRMGERERRPRREGMRERGERDTERDERDTERGERRERGMVEEAGMGPRADPPTGAPMGGPLPTLPTTATTTTTTKTLPAAAPMGGPGAGGPGAGAPMGGPGAGGPGAGAPMGGPGAGGPGAGAPADAENTLQTGPTTVGPHGPLSNADWDGDGQVTRAEMDQFVEGNRQRQIGLVAFLHENDTNGDEQLDPDELAVVDPPNAFDGSDENGDGTVTLEEATTYGNEEGRSYRAIGLDAFFDLVDTNSDEVCDADEIQAAHDSGLLGWY